MLYQGKEFTEIPFGQGKYFICKDTTEILSMMRPNFPKLLKQCINSNGYLMVGFFSHPHRINVCVHRAMMETFKNNPNHFRDINHIDGNKLNNKLENLEYCTHKYNNQHSFKTGLHKKFTNLPVFKFDLKGNLLKKYTSLRKAANEMNCDPANICSALKGKTVHAKGYLWSYDPVYKRAIPDKIQKGYYIIKNNIKTYFKTRKEVLNYLGIAKTTFYSYCDKNKTLKDGISVHTDYY